MLIHAHDYCYLVSLIVVFPTVIIEFGTIDDHFTQSNAHKDPCVLY